MALSEPEFCSDSDIVIIIVWVLGIRAFVQVLRVPAGVELTVDIDPQDMH